MQTRKSFLFSFLILLLLSSTPQYIYGQFPGVQICPYCNKTFKNCAYKGKHSKCQTCGKVIGAKTNKCPYNGSHPKPQPTTGTLSINSTPSDAVVKIDGEYMGTTSLTLKNRKAGTYKVTFSAEGYETQTKSVTVTAGKTATCSATLKKKQAQQPVVQQPVQQSVQQPTTTTSTSASTQTITANGVSFKMIRVEGDTFTMGATSEQGSDTDEDEMPVHEVTLSAYYIGETEVTQELWEAVMDANPSKFKGKSRPVENVSWNDCKTFISKLNSITGKKFRLPTEAEWEFAARGGNKSKGYKFCGSSSLGNVAWHKDNSSSETHPVRTKSPNELGLCDMSGNVWEWCQDRYGSYSSSPQTNPSGPSSGSECVYRGGGYNSNAKYCRVSYRDSNAPSYRCYDLGLRLAL